MSYLEFQHDHPRYNLASLLPKRDDAFVDSNLVFIPKASSTLVADNVAALSSHPEQSAQSDLDVLAKLDLGASPNGSSKPASRPSSYLRAEQFQSLLWPIGLSVLMVLLGVTVISMLIGRGKRRYHRRETSYSAEVQTSHALRAVDHSQSRVSQYGTIVGMQTSDLPSYNYGYMGQSYHPRSYSGHDGGTWIDEYALFDENAEKRLMEEKRSSTDAGMTLYTDDHVIYEIQGGKK
jgi:hypothetical protein